MDYWVVIVIVIVITDFLEIYRFSTNINITDNGEFGYEL
jgi:hypothetical protein